MNFLIVDATQRELMICLGAGEKRFTYLGNDSARRHASMILTKIDELLTEAGVAIGEVDVLGAVTGPGSFTGIRIGVTTVNALARASGAKTVELTALESVVFGKDDVIALMDCKNDNFYALKRRAGEDEYLAVNASELDEARFNGLERVYYLSPDPSGAEKVLLKKVGKGEFTDLARPFYIKKSSAENQK